MVGISAIVRPPPLIPMPSPSLKVLQVVMSGSHAHFPRGRSGQQRGVDILVLRCTMLLCQGS